MRYHIRFIHAISPKATDLGDSFEWDGYRLPEAEARDAVGALLRRHDVHTGRLASFRREGPPPGTYVHDADDAPRFLSFPNLGGYYTRSDGSVGIRSGSGSIWHCIVLEPCPKDCIHRKDEY